MARKRITYVKPEMGKEEFVRHLFSIYAKELGFEIVNIQKAFPDCTAIDLRNNKRKRVSIEFEYEAQNFILHGHDKQMKEGEEYIVVCWLSKGIDQIPSNIEVIVLRDKKYRIEIAEIIDVIEVDGEKPLYRIIPYNPRVAYGKEFASFEDAKIFRTNIRIKENRLPKGSVIVLYEKGWLIGEFTVVSYIYIEKRPETEYEMKLYRLISYPVTIAEDPLSDDKWTKGHIIYTGFKIYDPPVDFTLLGKNIAPGGRLLDFAELQMIRGRKRFVQSET